MYGISDTYSTIPGPNAAAYNLRISEKHTFSQMAKRIPHDRPMDSIHWNHLKLWIDRVADPKTMKLLHCLLMKMPCFWGFHLGLYHWPKWKRNRLTQLYRIMIPGMQVTTLLFLLFLRIFRFWKKVVNCSFSWQVPCMSHHWVTMTLWRWPFEWLAEVWTVPQSGFPAKPTNATTSWHHTNLLFTYIQWSNKNHFETSSAWDISCEIMLEYAPSPIHSPYNERHRPSQNYTAFWSIIPLVSRKRSLSPTCITIPCPYFPSKDHLTFSLNKNQ